MNLTSTYVLAYASLEWGCCLAAAYQLMPLAPREGCATMHVLWGNEAGQKAYGGKTMLLIPGLVSEARRCS